MHFLENDILKIQVNTKGAELDSIYHKKHSLQYLWNGDPAFWAKKSPVLFPIVGTLKNDEYYFESNSYKLGRHGFAREKEFEVGEQSANTLQLSLLSDNDTMKHFPFSFRFDVVYTLDEDALAVTYNIYNADNKTIFFSVGGHPAFKVPLVVNLSYDDYYLEFDQPENAARWPISKDGLIEIQPVKLLENSKRISLSKSLFQQDALVFKELRSNRISLKSGKDSHGIDFNFDGFPFLGIWAAKNADFVCIEPWCGIADSVNTDQQLNHKEGINVLGTGEIFSRTWRVTMF